MEKAGDRSPRAARSGPATAPSKGLRAVFTPLVDYGDDSDEEPDSPGQYVALYSAGHVMHTKSAYCIAVMMPHWL